METQDLPKAKARKPYTITKQREKWTDEEHQKFLEALKVHGRAWRKIEEAIGTKTTVQIRSHAQKFFSKLERQKDRATAEEQIDIPPPRAKRKPSLPYPRNGQLPSPSEAPSNGGSGDDDDDYNGDVSGMAVSEGDGGPVHGNHSRPERRHMATSPRPMTRQGSDAHQALGSPLDSLNHRPGAEAGRTPAAGHASRHLTSTGLMSPAVAPSLGRPTAANVGGNVASARPTLNETVDACRPALLHGAGCRSWQDLRGTSGAGTPAVQGVQRGQEKGTDEEVSEVTVAAVVAAASAAAAAAALAVVAAAGQQIQVHMQNHPPRGFPFYGLPPALLAAMSLAAPSLETAGIQAALLEDAIAINSHWLQPSDMQAADAVLRALPRHVHASLPGAHPSQLQHLMGTFSSAPPHPLLACFLPNQSHACASLPGHTPLCSSNSHPCSDPNCPVLKLPRGSLDPLLGHTHPLGHGTAGNGPVLEYKADGRSTQEQGSHTLQVAVAKARVDDAKGNSDGISTCSHESRDGGDKSGAGASGMPAGSGSSSPAAASGATKHSNNLLKQSGSKLAVGNSTQGAAGSLDAKGAVGEAPAGAAVAGSSVLSVWSTPVVDWSQSHWLPRGQSHGLAAQRHDRIAREHTAGMLLLSMQRGSMDLGIVGDDEQGGNAGGGATDHSSGAGTGSAPPESPCRGDSEQQAEEQLHKESNLQRWRAKVRAGDDVPESTGHGSSGTWLQQSVNQETASNGKKSSRAGTTITNHDATTAGSGPISLHRQVTQANNGSDGNNGSDRQDGAGQRGSNGTGGSDGNNCGSDGNNGGPDDNNSGPEQPGLKDRDTPMHGSSGDGSSHVHHHHRHRGTHPAAPSHEPASRERRHIPPLPTASKSLRNNSCTLPRPQTPEAGMWAASVRPCSRGPSDTLPKVPSADTLTQLAVSALACASTRPPPVFPVSTPAWAVASGLQSGTIMDPAVQAATGKTVTGRAGFDENGRPLVAAAKKTDELPGAKTVEAGACDPGSQAANPTLCITPLVGVAATGGQAIGLTSQNATAADGAYLLHLAALGTTAAAVPSIPLLHGQLSPALGPSRSATPLPAASLPAVDPSLQVLLAALAGGTAQLPAVLQQQANAAAGPWGLLGVPQDGQHLGQQPMSTLGLAANQPLHISDPVASGLQQIARQMVSEMQQQQQVLCMPATALQEQPSAVTGGVMASNHMPLMIANLPAMSLLGAQLFNLTQQAQLQTLDPNMLLQQDRAWAPAVATHDCAQPPAGHNHCASISAGKDKVTAAVRTGSSGSGGSGCERDGGSSGIGGSGGSGTGVWRQLSAFSPAILSGGLAEASGRKRQWGRACVSRNESHSDASPDDVSALSEQEREAQEREAAEGLCGLALKRSCLAPGTSSPHRF